MHNKKPTHAKPQFISFRSHYIVLFETARPLSSDLEWPMSYSIAIISQLTAGYCHFGWLAGWLLVSRVCRVCRVSVCLSAYAQLGSARTRPRVAYRTNIQNDIWAQVYVSLTKILRKIEEPLRISTKPYIVGN